jgi:hypothetical protein
MRKGVGTISVVVVAMLVGCGGGSGSGGSGGGGGSSGGGKGGGSGNSGGTFTASVPGGTPLTGLSGPQGTQLCNDFRTYAETTLAPGLCRVEGLLLAELSGATTDATVQAACASGYQSCLTSDAGVTVTCNLSATPSTCTATVGDFTACLNAQSAAIQQFPSCSTLTAAMLASFFADGGSSSSAPPPAVCAPFQKGGPCASAVMMPGSSAGAP